MPPLDQYSDFQDDGGTPEWRRRHPPTITVPPTMRAAFKELMRREPLIGLWLGMALAIGLWLSFAIMFAGFLVYALVCRLVGYE